MIYSRKVKYRYTCEHCGEQTEWFEGKMTQSTGLAGKADIRGRMSTDKLMKNSEKVIESREKATKSLNRRIKIITKALASDGVYVVIENEPFVLQEYNDLFKKTSKCPFCRMQQSWSTALTSMSEWTVDTELDPPEHINRPEIEFGEIEADDEEDKEKQLAEIAELAESYAASFDPNRADLPLSDFLSLDLTYDDKEDVALQVCEKVAELAESGRYVVKIDITDILVKADRGLIFGENWFISGGTEQDSLNALFDFIKPIDHKKMTKLAKQRDEIEDLSEFSKKMYQTQLPLLVRFAPFIMMLVFLAFIGRRLWQRALKSIFEFFGWI